MNEFLDAIESSLPESKYEGARTEPDCYGASKIVSDGLSLPLIPLSYASWYHGWPDARYDEIKITL